MARLCSGVSGAAWTCWGPENGLPSSAILSLLADREGTLWLGLNGAGLLQWVGQPWTHRTRWPGEPLAQSLDVISVAATRDGGVLASVFGRGILRWDGSRLATWGRADGLEEDVRAVVEPAPGSVWAGARHGVFEKDRRGRFRRALALSNGFASGFARDPQGTWHVFTDAHGIFRRDARWQPAAELNALVPGTLVRAMQWTDDGDLWIAAARELVVRRRSGVVERHPLGLERGLPDTISSLLVVGPHEIWAGGQGGLAIRERGEWRLLTQAEGVPGNVYFLRRAPDGTTWVGGSRGIARVRSGRWTTWDRTSGLVGDECNGGAILLADGTLLAATAGSLARFDPSVPSRPAAPLQVRWREPADARDASVIRRPADQRRVVLGWSAPWLGPHPVEYSTRIADGAWSAPTRSTQVAVENLPAGRSDVAVRARRVGLAGDDWSAPLALGVEVAPRLAETTGARVAVTLAVVALLLLGAHLAARRAHARREQALARMRTDFMGSASHELRTPIAQIRLFADMLRLGRARNEGERSEALQTIHRATVRLEALAGNLMRLARGEARVPVSLPQRVDVAALVREAAQDVSALAAARGAELQVEAEPGLQGVVDVEGVRVVLSNLLENALKYGPAGQVVRLGAEQTADGLRVFVEDEGPGIPPADREHVWERFARLDRDRNSSIGGTGLGLAVVRETVAQAGGEAHIEDVEPSGTRVVVLLPQPDGETPAVGPAASREVMP
jgi:signal transduction histidine kinase